MSIREVEGVMIEERDQISTGKKIAFTIGGLVIAGVYFLYFLDIALMKMQGLDYCYNFPDWLGNSAFELDRFQSASAKEESHGYHNEASPKKGLGFLGARDVCGASAIALVPVASGWRR